MPQCSSHQDGKRWVDSEHWLPVIPYGQQWSAVALATSSVNRRTSLAIHKHNFHFDAWAWTVGLAWRCRRRFDPRSRSFSLSSTSIFFFSFFNVYIYLYALFVSAAILLFVPRRFVLAASSACFFPFFLPPPNPQSTVSVRT